MTRSKNATEIANELLLLKQKYNIKAYKVKIAKVMGNNTDVYPNRSEDVIVQCRETLGNNVMLMADANGGYTNITLAKILHY